VIIYPPEEQYSMKIGQFEDHEGLCVGVERAGTWINYSKAEALFYLLRHGVPIEPATTLQGMLESGEYNAGAIRQVVDYLARQGMTKQVAVHRDAVLKAPILRPPKIVALGLNYVLHAREGSFAVPSEPVVFAKAGSSVIGPNETVRIPRGMGRMDHEIELAVVIGKKASGVKRKRAYEYVAGYTICNDVTARALQTRDIENRHPWFRSKSFDTFTPLGPWMVTVDEIKPPIRLDLECRVNGRIRQRSNTRHLLFDIPAIIEFVSRHITLEPGDIISTGTPEGIGPIKHGDTMICRIAKIGELRNPVRSR
jgi:5-oxopent-3-ene-1,2,5-tricarboxylate decarboxylase/2-hydroxyhepta-2,4-diene-1,7-dioate isomerase